MSDKFNPNFKTPEADFCKEEINKQNSNGIRGTLAAEFRSGDPHGELTWEAEALAKSHGIYMEIDRGEKKKNFFYMVRISIPSGGPISREQWQVFDELSEKYTWGPRDHKPSIRFTTRQNIQFHWVRKEHVVEIVRRIAESGFFSLNGCGDNTRNVMGCPLSRFSDVFNAHALAERLANYFQLPAQPFIEIFGIDPTYLRKPGEEKQFDYGPRLLNRKFKIAISTVHRDEQTGNLFPDNCVELLTNDLAIAPVFEGVKQTGYQVYIGGGQGEKNGKPTMAALAKPFAFVTEEQLMSVLDAIVTVHKEWGDRQNRHWARIKYVVKKMGIPWFRERVAELVGFMPAEPLPDFNYGPRHLHHGWTKQPSNGLWSFCAYIENGRIVDSDSNGRLKTAVRELMNKYRVELMGTANQDIMFTNIPESAKKDFVADLESYGWGKRNGKAYSKLRMFSGACVGRDTCRLTYTDSEKFEPELLDELEAMGWGDVEESIGITGCERQCFRPSTKSIGLIGSGFDRYEFKLMGTEDARTQGRPVLSEDGALIYLRTVPREKVATVIDALFRNYTKSRNNGEDLGRFHQRIGMQGIIDFLKADAATTALMEKPQKAHDILTP